MARGGLGPRKIAAADYKLESSWKFVGGRREPRPRGGFILRDYEAISRIEAEVVYRVRLNFSFRFAVGIIWNIVDAEAW